METDLAILGTQSAGMLCVFPHINTTRLQKNNLSAVLAKHAAPPEAHQHLRQPRAAGGRRRGSFVIRPWLFFLEGLTCSVRRDRLGVLLRGKSSNLKAIRHCGSLCKLLTFLTFHLTNHCG